MTLFQAHWKNIAERLGLAVEFDVSISLPSGRLVAPVVLRRFGAREGMVLVPQFEEVRRHSDCLADAGFGYSTLGEPTSENFDVDSVIEMLRDWGWMGSEPAPTWLREDAT